MTTEDQNLEELEPTSLPQEHVAQTADPETDPEDQILVEGVRLSYVRLFEKRPLLRQFLRLKAAATRDPAERKAIHRLVGDGQALDALMAHISTMPKVPKDGNKFLDFLKENWAEILRAILAIISVM